MRDVAAALHAMGCYEVSLGDTIGTGTAGKTQATVRDGRARRSRSRELAGHFHDTYGQALANVYAAMELGVATFDCSVAGLGGCPYAKGATGNVASEDVLYLLDGLGIETGVDMTRLRRAGQFISDFLGRPPVSRVARALDAKSRLPTEPRMSRRARLRREVRVALHQRLRHRPGHRLVRRMLSRTLDEIAGVERFARPRTERTVIAALAAAARALRARRSSAALRRSRCQR